MPKNTDIRLFVPIAFIAVTLLLSGCEAQTQKSCKERYKGGAHDAFLKSARVTSELTYDVSRLSSELQNQIEENGYNAWKKPDRTTLTNSNSDSIRSNFLNEKLDEGEATYFASEKLKAYKISLPENSLYEVITIGCDNISDNVNLINLRYFIENNDNSKR